jgi:GNAT superfamily N-acetyltransferase
MSGIRPCAVEDRGTILAIINAAAEAYRGVIPDDLWHEPYMTLDALDREIITGVKFWGYELDSTLAGVMGFQSMRGASLIRHAYVLPERQRRGIGGALLTCLMRQTTGLMLVGTWSAAAWAIRFYRRHGFDLVAPARKRMLLTAYWNVPDRQIEASVVLANPPVDEA